MANTFGNNWTFTSFGESHGAAIGGVLDGVPAGLHIDLPMIREELERRSGNGQVGASPRAKNEPDEVEWLSGVLEGVTLGTPIAFIIRNKDARPEDYEWLKHNYRVGHADKVYEQKYGIRDHRGGGRASARETAARVVAGCIAKQELAQKGIEIHADLVQVGTETDPAKFADLIASYQREGDSIGGIVERTTGGHRRTDLRQTAGTSRFCRHEHQRLQRLRIWHRLRRRHAARLCHQSYLRRHRRRHL